MHQSKSKKKERHIGLRMGFEVQINFELNCRTPSYSSYSNGGGAEIEVRDWITHLLTAIIIYTEEHQLYPFKQVHENVAF